jgi:hypothetical protein
MDRYYWPGCWPNTCFKLGACRGWPTGLAFGVLFHRTPKAVEGKAWDLLAAFGFNSSGVPSRRDTQIAAEITARVVDDVS